MCTFLEKSIGVLDRYRRRAAVVVIACRRVRGSDMAPMTI